jgi:hypothetical protein
MSKMLCRECLSLEERVYLANLSQHPGFAVLKKLMDEACQQATRKAIALDPEDPQYEHKLKARHLEARTMNDFAASVILSIKAHVESMEAEENETKEAENLLKSLQ